MEVRRKVKVQKSLDIVIEQLFYFLVTTPLVSTEHRNLITFLSLYQTKCLGYSKMHKAPVKFKQDLNRFLNAHPTLKPEQRKGLFSFQESYFQGLGYKVARYDMNRMFKPIKTKKLVPISENNSEKTHTSPISTIKLRRSTSEG